MHSSLSAHQLLEKLAYEEVSTASFPTHFSVILRLRTAMNDRQAPHRKIHTMLKGEPVISARILQTANSAANHGRGEISDLNTAIMALGLSSVRRIALGVVMTQLAKSKEMLVFSHLSRSLWLHSLETAVSSFVFASELTTLNPDEAFFSGLVLNMGAFYLLYQAARYPELQRAPDDVNQAVKKYHASATKKVLIHMNLPTAIIDATDMTDFQPENMELPPKTMADVVKAANIMAMEEHPWFESFTANSKLGSIYTDLRDQISKGVEKLQEEFN